jgi:hypothetical protein
MKRFLKVTTCLRGGNKIVTICEEVIVHRDEEGIFIKGVEWIGHQNCGCVLHCDIHEIQSVDFIYLSKFHTNLIRIHNFFKRVF